MKQEEFSAMDLQQQQALQPANVYADVAAAMHPVSPSDAQQDLQPAAMQNDINARIIADLRSEFDAAVVDASLPQPSAPDSDILAYERLRSQLCVEQHSPR